MTANDIYDTGILTPRIEFVSVSSDKKILVRWLSGKRAGKADEIDLSPIINTYKIFRPLRDDTALFKTLKVADDGRSIAWSGDDLELAAEAVESLAEQTMSPADFVAFMKRFKLTEAAIASILGYSRRQIGYFKTTGPIPRVVALACKGYELEQLEKTFWPANDYLDISYQTHEMPPLPRPKIRVA